MSTPETVKDFYADEVDETAPAPAQGSTASTSRRGLAGAVLAGAVGASSYEILLAGSSEHLPDRFAFDPSAWVVPGIPSLAALVDTSSFSGPSSWAATTSLQRYARDATSPLQQFEELLALFLRRRVHEVLWRQANLDIRELGSPLELAERMVAAIPGSHVFDEIVGPFYDSAGLMKWLKLGPEDLQGRIADRSILACQTDDGDLVYPSWQFLDDGAVLPGLTAVLNAFSETNDSWQIAIWLSSPSVHLNGEPPRSWLRQLLDPEVVVDMAVKTAARWRS
jgi:hypothetical protein